MKILVVSDTPVRELNETFSAEEVSGVELILSCGDLPPEYLATVRERLDVPMYSVPGNHDLRYRQTPVAGCVDAHGRLVRSRGLRILGLGGCRWYNGGPYQYHEAEMRRMIRRLWPRLWLAGGVDVVFTHAPVRGVGDAEDRCHRGFRCFRRLIARYSPRAFVHGHIHAAFTRPEERVTMFGQTRIINCCGSVIIDV